MNDSTLKYDVTARFDDGIYKIVNNEWVAIERWHPKPKTVDLRHGFALITTEDTKMEPKMTHFQRFLPIFAYIYGGFSLGIAIIMGVAAGADYIRQLFGLTAALVAVFITIAVPVSALLAWSLSEDKS